MNFEIKIKKYNLSRVKRGLTQGFPEYMWVLHLQKKKTALIIHKRLRTQIEYPKQD